MQYFIDQNQVSFEEFCSHVPSAKLLVDFDDLAIAIHCDDDHVYYIAMNRQKVEIKVKNILDYHQKFFYKNSLYSQPLFKALGLKKSQPKPRVLDCTAGTLKDALLIYHGFEAITCCERNPLAQFLIQTALEQQPLENFHFIAKACTEIDLGGFDCLYYDPMYQTKNAKALPRKEMQFFRDHIGNDQDIDSVFSYLLKSKKRLVLKRSQKSSAMGSPHHSYGEKSTIYDVYLPR